MKDGRVYLIHIRDCIQRIKLNLVYFENCSFKVKIVGLLPYVAMTKLHFSSWTRFIYPGRQRSIFQ
jgi:hypothetical protein